MDRIPETIWEDNSVGCTSKLGKEGGTNNRNKEFIKIIIKRSTVQTTNNTKRECRRPRIK